MLRNGGEEGDVTHALKLLAVLIQHTDSKPAQQRLMCVSDQPEDADVPCLQPVMMVSDLGLTFGRKLTRHRHDPRFKQGSWRRSRRPLGMATGSGGKRPAVADPVPSASVAGSLQHPLSPASLDPLRGRSTPQLTALARCHRASARWEETPHALVEGACRRCGKACVRLFLRYVPEWTAPRLAMAILLTFIGLMGILFIPRLFTGRGDPRRDIRVPAP